MESARQPTLRELFDACVELPDDARSRYLAEHCTDGAQRDEVERLLRADADDDAIFSGGASAAASAIGDVRAPRPPAGGRIGPFEVLDVLGEGGSSTVFRACREDAGVRQEVALKVLHRGLYTPDAQRQFRRERQALAQLNHPGIARFIEGNVTDSGVAYIALELVDGQPLTNYVRERQSPLRIRLELFVQVCRAVEAAHRALIVHRDLKPSNVLVTTNGAIKLVDFGIAKLLDVDETQTRMPMLTPAYAAPEQHSGGAITTATDVYALGILLGELVTGKRLQGGDGRTPSSQVENTGEKGLLPADAVATERTIRGDIDNIILKAIDPTPERRYASAGAFADDIERWLDGRPVAAHPPSRWYRTRKFLLRHRGAALSSAIFLLGIIAALTIALWQARVANEQAKVAEREAKRANATKDFLIGVFRASDPLRAQDKPRGQITAKELLDINAPKINDQFPDDPRTRIELLGVAASIYGALDDDAHYQTLHKQQLELARQVDGELSPLIIEGQIDQAQYASRRHDYVAAKKFVEEADASIQRAHLDESWLRAYWWFARGATLQGDFEQRQTRTDALTKAAALYEKYGPTHTGWAEVLYALGSDSVNDPARAEHYMREAIDRMKAMPQPDEAALQVFYGSLALVQQMRADYTGAEASYAKATEIAKRTIGEHNPRYWIQMSMQARMVHRLGDRARADQMFADLLPLFPAEPKAQEIDGVADARQFYSETLNAEGRPGEALPVLTAVMERRKQARIHDQDIRIAHSAIGDALDQLGRPDEARPHLEAALKEWTEKFPADSFFVLQSRERLGRFLLDHGDTAGAEKEFREVLAQAHDRHFAPIALAHGGLARIALARSDVAAAKTEVDIAIETFAHPTGLRDIRGEPYLWLIRSDIALRAGDRASAKEWAQRALDASLKYDDPNAASIRNARAALTASTATR